jgi:predicted esterase
MEPRFRAIIMVLRVVVLAACAHLFVSAPPVLAQPGGGQPDPRVQVREYLFEDTNEQIPYAVFVSSKVRPDISAPLVIALHGLGGTHMSLMRGNALDLAEEGGYILVGPMGYNPRGWYGVPATGGGRGRGAAATPPAGAPPAPPAAPQAQAGAGQPPATGATPQGRGRGGAGANDPPNVRELSEKDVMNVLERVRKEFNVDDRRTYVMGHSMGGAGTFHLAVKYPEHWAAAAAIAPAAFGLDPKSLSAITDMPMMIVHGDGDTVVSVTVGRTWAESMRELKMTHEYLEIEGGDHGNVITIGMPDIFRFFGSHAKPGTR